MLYVDILFINHAIYGVLMIFSLRPQWGWIWGRKIYFEGIPVGENPLARRGGSTVWLLTHADGQAVKGVHDADGEGQIGNFCVAEVRLQRLKCAIWCAGSGY